MTDSPLAPFHPLIAKWFSETYGAPTDAQAKAWPAIAAGEHVLVTAPTGSGKTLTAFLYALNQLAVGAWPTGGIRVLYISPLKALNTDIKQNLLTPLAELHRTFAEAAEPFPPIRVMVRSGDTPQSERRQFLRRPPEIFITTPESLNILLATTRGRELLGGLETVILDEIHAVVDSKRGTHLITAVDRLVPLSGEFQRVALSATVKPLEPVAQFVGGYVITKQLDGESVYAPRPVTIIEAVDQKQYEIEVRFNPPSGIDSDAFWRGLAVELKELIAAHRSTLVFVNSRRMCEKVALYLNDKEPEPIAYAHHGSLSRETRQVVEQRLKAGELKAIVATSSLELGIDIGALEQVLLVQTPFAVNSTIQRVGRAGHAVGEVSRSRIYPTHGRDLVNAAVMTRCVLDRDLEPLRPLEGPLDVLAQEICALAAAEPWNVEELYDFLRCSYPYRRLSYRAYELVLEMLAGRYADTRLTSLKPRLELDRLHGIVRAPERTARLVSRVGGTIPDRGYYTLRHAGSRARVGELDEEFVWERRVGDSFTFGTQTWRIEQITPNEVMVTPTAGTRLAPFWRNEPMSASSHFCGRVGEFLEWLDPRLADPLLLDELQTLYRVDERAARAMVDYLEQQKLATGAPLPHRHHLLVEYVADAGGAENVPQVVLHTLWGGRLNRPYGLCLAGAWQERFGQSIELFAENDCVVLIPQERMPPDELLAMVQPERVEELLRFSLEHSGVFGARFRENAGRAMLLPRSGPRQRMPLWLLRERAKKLLEAVAPLEDFPLLAETWRTCLDDEFDLDLLRERLTELRDGQIKWTLVETDEPSPFAGSATWLQTNKLMYLDDTPGTDRTRLSEDLIREVALTAQLRPELSPELTRSFEARLQQTAPGYSPADSDELLALLRDRVLIPVDQWTTLLTAIARDHEVAEPELLEPLADRVVWLTLPGGTAAVTALEAVPRIAAAAGVEPSAIELAVLSEGTTPTLAPGDWERLAPRDPEPLTGLLTQLLQFHGPVLPQRLVELLGVGLDRLGPAALSLVDSETWLADRLTRGVTEVEWCDRDNLERLLRLARRDRAPSFEPLPASRLPLFLADLQGVAQRESGSAGFRTVLERLLGYPAPAANWEAEILPARVANYDPAWLDQALRETELTWLGCGPEQLTFIFPDVLELLGSEVVGDRLTESVPADDPEHWAAAWRGALSCGSFAPVRQLLGSTPAPRPREPNPDGWKTRRRGAANRWRHAPGFEAQWFAVEPPEPADDPIDAIELDKDRIRLLLSRWGILFRELLQRELPGLSWSSIFRTARLMELSGELFAGYFIDGLPGLQFASPSALSRLRGRLPEDAIYWLAATDPASACGLKVEGLDLPARRAGTHLVYHGEALVLISTRSGRDLEFRVQPEAPGLPEYLGFITEQQRRLGQPVKRIAVETINGEPARESDYLPVLRECFDVLADYREVKLYPKRGDV